jgi:hypothetical protein
MRPSFQIAAKRQVGNDEKDVMPQIDFAKTPSFRLDGKRALVTAGGRGWSDRASSRCLSGRPMT